MAGAGGLQAKPVRSVEGDPTHRPGRRAAGCCCILLALAVAACSSSGGGAGVPAAQAKVSAKSSAVSQAKSELTAKTDAFCTSAQTYITGLDRYGDVLSQSEPTVGDVKQSGQELTQPREQVLSDAQAAVTAQQDLVTAQNELAQADAALKSAQASASGGPTPTITPSSKTAAPLAPAATVNRVKQADSDFATAQRGITDATALADASQRFNAAAVALEMSWLQLFADAGCLTDEQQKTAEQAVHDYTVALQESLADAGYFSGDVDGVYGPSTVDAVEALQKAHGLPVTGTVDKATDAALQADLQKKGGAAAQGKTASTAAVQQTLKLAGFWTGPVDGNWTPELTDALKSFQTELGVKPTGTVDAATVNALEHAIANVQAAKASPSPTPTPSQARPAPSRGVSSQPAPTGSSTTP